MTCLVTIDLDEYDQLPPRQQRALLRALRFADRDGVAHASLNTLAMPGLSRSAIHRDLRDLEHDGHITRQERPGGGFDYRIAKRFQATHPLWERVGPGLSPPEEEGAPRRVTHPLPEGVDEGPSRRVQSRPHGRAGTSGPQDQGCQDPADGLPVPAAETLVPQAGTTDSRGRAVKVFSSSENHKPSERELSLDGEIPDGWIAAAATERRRVDLPDVDLRVEWRKLVIYTGGVRITLGRWLMWAMRARLDHSNAPPAATVEAAAAVDMPAVGDDQQRARARGWVRTGRWAPQGVTWGPAPNQPGCELPADLVAWCLAGRGATA